MKTETQLSGTQGEDLAASYLEAQGLKVRSRHYLTRWGEIDLICQDRDATWVFVEVKARARPSLIPILEVITPAKQKKIVGAALSYLKKHGLKDQNVRFDVVVIEGPQLEWIPSAFEPSFPYTY